MVESGRVPGKGIDRASNKKLSKRVSRNGRISVRTGKRIESGRFPGKGRIRASIELLSERVPKNGRISVTTGKLSNPGVYLEMV